MDSLSTAPVADVLARLFAEAEAADQPLFERFAEIPQDEGATRLLEEEAKDYRKVYADFAGNYLSITAELGEFLYACARSIQARRIVEFGTSFGISTVYLATALADGGGGHLIGSELEPTKAQRAQENLAAAGVGELADIRVGDA